MFRTALISMFLTSTALADTWTVDNNGKADFDNIQAAIDAASDGCNVIVPQGRSTSSVHSRVDCSDHQVIDILWCYTPLALAQVDDAKALRALTDIDIETTNTAFTNSNLPFRTRTVGFVETNYDESGDHLGLLQGQNDGVMDEIHGIRDAVAADIVALVTVDGYCGIAYLAPSNEAYGFQKITIGCLGGGVLRHELGHNLGSKHWATDAGGYFPYSCGHVLEFNDGAEAGTAMGGNALPHYSNPQINYDGVPTGVPIGSADSANNWLAFMQTAPMVAKFRCSGDCNGNDIPDEIEISDGTAEDCDGNGTPDDCQVDINQNGIIDACENLPVSIRVPEQFSSIQFAMSMVESGIHEIVVGPGVWSETIDTLGKAVTLRSEFGAEVTSIDASGFTRAMTIRSGEGLDTIIDGFTLTGGSAASDGGGLLIEYSSPTIKNCVFTNNHSTYAGGAIRITDGSGRIENCLIKNNSSLYGGGVSTWSGAPLFTNCKFLNNESLKGGSGGGFSSWDSQPILSICEFRDNTTYGSGGALFTNGNTNYQPHIEGTYFCGNEPNHINNTAWQDGGGNIFQDLCPGCFGDVTGDLSIDVSDLLVVIDQWGSDNSAADINDDGVVDVTDLLIVISNWGPCP